ncbi:MAG: hypothetical protein AAB958_00260 [Patescibacteria group bacterium]
MKKYLPFNNIVLCQILEKERDSAIFLPNEKQGRFIRIKILKTGGLVNHQIKEGDICIANNLFEIIDPSNPEIGFINEKDILGKEIDGPAES